MSADESHPSHEPPECVACGNAIGVYEPFVQVHGETARRTSRAAEPEVYRSGGICYHAGCYGRGQPVI